MRIGEGFPLNLYTKIKDFIGRLYPFLPFSYPFSYPLWGTNVGIRVHGRRYKDGKDLGST